jgi:methyl-accepting chemotaxis protein
MRITIGRKIIIAAIILISLFVSINIYTFYQINQTKDRYNYLLTEVTPEIQDVKDVNTEIWYQNAQIRGYILTGNSNYAQLYQNSKQKTETILERLEIKMVSPQALKEFAVLKMAVKTYNQTLEQGLKVRDKVGIQDTIKYMDSTGQRADAVGKIMEDFIIFTNQEISEKINETNDSIATMQKSIFVIDVSIFLLLIFAATFLGNRIGALFGNVAKIAEEIATGNLTPKSVSYRYNDEIGDLIGSFNAMVIKLRNLIEQVAMATEQVSAASEQLNASTEETARSVTYTAEVASNVAGDTFKQEEGVRHTTLVTQEMSTTIDNIVHSVTVVSSNSSQTASVAKEGGKAVGGAIMQMAMINDVVIKSAQSIEQLNYSSSRIGEIISVIRQIADQTNLLALNAAIEAARAGESGRGFAVVADEVRKLAEQSHKASEEIALIIQEIQKETLNTITIMEQGTLEVQKGTTVISNTGEQFENIINLVEGLNSQIQSISTAADKLFTASGTMVDSVQHIKEITHNTSTNIQTISSTSEEQSATMEEIASSSIGLTNLAEKLRETVSQFKL